MKRSSYLSLDWPIIFCLLIIISLGLTILSSISPQELRTQITFVISGSLLFLLMAQIEAELLKKIAPAAYVIAVIFLLMTFVFGQSIRGSTRWIQLFGVNLQTSELVKPFLIISFAYFTQKYSLQGISGLIKVFSLIILPVFLVFKQPDLGSAIIILSFGLGILFSSGIRPLHLFIVSLVTLTASPLIWSILKSYQKERLLTFLNPYADPLGRGYHLIQSIIAVGSGHIFGRGLGHGTQSYLRFLPEHHTDFIFASFSEEFGFLGSLILLVAYAALLLRLLHLSEQTPDKLSYLIIIGTFSMLFFQIMINIGMNLGLVPITGVTLPLISSGGSSFIAIMIALGFVQSISRQRIPHQPRFHLH